MTKTFAFRALLSGALLLGVTVTGPATAQDQKAMSEARAKFQKAVELKSAKNWGGALKLFREVGQVKMTVQVRYHIAQCEENLGQLVTALGGYDLAISQAETDGAPEEFMAELNAAVESLRSRIPKVTISRGAGAEAATIQLDEVQLGANQLDVEIPVDPGPHAVVATSAGFREFRQTVTVKERESQRIELVLEKLPEATIASTEPVASGAQGNAAPEEEKGFGPWPYVLGGAGLAGIVTGVILLPVSQGKASEAKDICGGTDCTGLTDPNDYDKANALVSDARTLETVGWIATGVGVAAVGAGVALFFLDPTRAPKDEPQASAFRFVPTAPAADAGWSVVGSF